MDNRLKTQSLIPLEDLLQQVIKLAGIGLLTSCAILEVGCVRPLGEEHTPTQGLNLQQIRTSAAAASSDNVHRQPIQYSTHSTPRVDTGQLDSLGRPVTVSCASCHSNDTDRPRVAFAEQLQVFHQGLVFQHGAVGSPLTCLTCHYSENYNDLRLADGRPLDYRESRQLCAQCHAAQDRDFEHGAHGGMTGYWDRSRGVQVRKTCIDCHDPHSPQFLHMLPTFKPLDRFLKPFNHQTSVNPVGRTQSLQLK